MFVGLIVGTAEGKDEMVGVWDGAPELADGAVEAVGETDGFCDEVGSSLGVSEG